MKTVLAINKTPIPEKTKTRPSIIAVVVVLVLGSIEGGVRVLEFFQDEIQQLPGISSFLRSGLVLDPYEMASTKGGYHWVLKPGFAATMEALAESKWDAGKQLGAKALQEFLAKPKQNPDETVALYINSDGFKGREIDKSHSRIRILTIGDSCTFGVGDQDYPTFMEQSLNQSGPLVEVVNAGVEGYSFRNVMIELDRYLELKPDIVTIYLGWNSLYPQNPFENSFIRNIRSLHVLSKLFKFARRLTIQDKDHALKLYSRELHPDKNENDVARLDNFEPPFLWRLEKIIDAFEESGSRIVILTLPGLFSMDDVPSRYALEIGHLPEYTDNPYVLAKLTERYNESLKNLANRRGVDVIDLAKWSNLTDLPRDQFFSDSVHLTYEGMGLVGAYLASQLMSIVTGVLNETPSTPALKN